MPAIVNLARNLLLESHRPQRRSTYPCPDQHSPICVLSSSPRSFRRVQLSLLIKQASFLSSGYCGDPQLIKRQRACMQHPAPIGTSTTIPKPKAKGTPQKMGRNVVRARGSECLLQDVSSRQDWEAASMKRPLHICLNKTCMTATLVDTRQWIRKISQGLTLRSQSLLREQNQFSLRMCPPEGYPIPRCHP